LRHIKPWRWSRKSLLCSEKWATCRLLI
jgi:hypothetical protein